MNMNDEMPKITKTSLKESTEFIRELKLDEEDYEKIHTTFKEYLESPELKEVMNKIPKEKIDEMNETTDMVDLMNLLIEYIPLDLLMSLLAKIVKNEKLTDYIQDLFLEKLV